MAQEYSQKPSQGIIIAGTGALQRSFHVRRSALEKSPVMKGWIEQPGNIPSSISGDGALNFKAVDPGVMGTVVRYLERDEREQWTFDLRGNDGQTLRAPVDHLFYVRVYKLALSLAIEDLCKEAVRQIGARKPTTEVFIDIVLEADRGKLIESKRFRDWILGYMKKHAEQLHDSKIFREAIEGGGMKAWAICSVLMKGLEEDPEADSAVNEVMKDGKNSKSDPLLTPRSSSKQTPTTSSSSYSPSSTLYGVSHSSYCWSPPKSPAISKPGPQASKPPPPPPSSFFFTGSKK